MDDFALKPENGLLFHPEAEQVELPPDKDHSPADGGCGHADLVHRVGSDEFIFTTGTDHENAMFFAGTEYLAIGSHGGSCESAAAFDGLLVEQFAGGTLVAGQQSAVRKGIKLPVIYQWGRHIGSPAFYPPLNKITRVNRVGNGEFAFSAHPDGIDRENRGVSSCDENQAVHEHRGNPV